MSMPAYRTAILDMARAGSGRLVITYSNGERNANQRLTRACLNLMTQAKGGVIFAAGHDLLTALKQSNLFPVPSVTCPTVGKEPDHDHDPPSP